jgi:dTDP-4-dehydrorhamnose 3,5-epimerase
MPIQVEETAIPGVKIIRGTRFHDERGFFTETYKESEYLEIGIPKFVQDNLSESSKGVIRGLHWQSGPHGQGKLVNCLSGAILDVAVDIRKDSPTFGQHVSVELKSIEQISLWVPEGFAHGFQALEDYTRVHYKVTNYWNKESEKGLLFDDPGLHIKWKNLPAIVSKKDTELPTLEKFVVDF